MKKVMDIGVKYIGYYILLFGTFLLLSLGMNDHAFYLHMRRFIPAALACIVPYILIKKYSLKYFCSEILVACSWAYTIPVINHISNKNAVSSMTFPYEIAFGAYIFTALVLCKMLLNKNRACNFLYILFKGCLLLVPAVHLVHYGLFHHGVTTNTVMVVFQTNLTEALEYLHSVNPIIYAAALVALGLFFFLSYKESSSLKNHLEVVFLGKKSIYVTICLIPILAYYSLYSLAPRTGYLSTPIAVRNYFLSVAKYEEMHSKIAESLQVNNNYKSIKPHTIIMVIGESATRDFMSAFNSMEDNTTPWLKEQKDIILAKNAYAGAWNTVPALERALTEANFYNNAEFNSSISIIDIAKKAGYKTYWFSKQGKVGVYDTPITLVAETADVSMWDGSSPYDESLLDDLQKVNPQENNFVVLHLMGSHIDYNNRYPSKYQIWTDPDTSGRLADYKNSLLYTDTVLKEIFEYGERHLNMDAMVYFSDHGTDPNRSRDPDESRFIGLRVPLFVYLSKDYRDNNAEVVNALEANKDKFFSNDLMFNLMCGIMNISSEHYNEEESLTSTKYKFDINSVKAGLGTKNVKDDPWLEK